MSEWGRRNNPKLFSLVPFYLWATTQYRTRSITGQEERSMICATNDVICVYIYISIENGPTIWECEMSGLANRNWMDELLATYNSLDQIVCTIDCSSPVYSILIIMIIIMTQLNEQSWPWEALTRRRARYLARQSCWSIKSNIIGLALLVSRVYTGDHYESTRRPSSLVDQ